MGRLRGGGGAVEGGGGGAPGARRRHSHPGAALPALAEQHVAHQQTPPPQPVRLRVLQVCMCVCARARACMRAPVSVHPSCVRTRERKCVHTHAHMYAPTCSHALYVRYRHAVRPGYMISGPAYIRPGLYPRTHVPARAVLVGDRHAVRPGYASCSAHVRPGFGAPARHTPPRLHGVRARCLIGPSWTGAASYSDSVQLTTATAPAHTCPLQRRSPCHQRPVAAGSYSAAARADPVACHTPVRCVGAPC
jgi:hypothetical protein